RAVGEREVVGLLRYANVINHKVDLVRRNNFTNLVLDVVKDALSSFDAGRRRGADVELDLSSINRGEEIAADHREHHASQHKHQRGDDRDDEPPLEQHREDTHVPPAKQLESALEALVQPREDAS